jgi:16S rRNA (guanine1207-N2)-methyltransferase
VLAVHPPDSPEPEKQENAEEYYFSGTPSGPSRPSSVRLVLPDFTTELDTDSGIFSSSRIDPGTKILLMEVRDLPPGNLVDLGCGYGPIATTLLRRFPGQTVWAVDVNSRARTVCAQNLKANAQADSEFHVISPEEVPPDLLVAALVSNPPIRIGKQALHALLELWLGRLVYPTGVAWLVVHKHLGADSLTRWLESQGYLVTKVRSRQGYRILKVSHGEQHAPAAQSAP